MKVGTKSILFGVHQFLIHPLVVAMAWWILYGFPWDPRLWIAFVVHDLGYWGKPNMDGPEGESHPEFGARIMARLFGDEWGEFCYYHSRFLAARDGTDVSRLCFADKLSTVLEPWWFYLPRAWASGELREYMAKCTTGKYAHMEIDSQSPRAWLSSVKWYLVAWIVEHRDGREDTWTSLKPEEQRHDT